MNDDDLLIDANINRFKEGARVLEDIARFILKDFSLFQQIKIIKHKLKPSKIIRSPNTDIGGAAFVEKKLNVAILDIVHANARRMQESLRVLENIDNPEIYKPLRFESYAIHQQMDMALKNYLQLDKLRGIYPICDPQICPIEQIADILNQSGITICQLRMKRASKREIIKACMQFKTLLNNDILLIINDHIDIALAYADGVHLGQSDIPLETARKIAPDKFIIGITCHTLAEAISAEQQGASYIGVGAIFPTHTKSDATHIGLDTLNKIITQIKIPVCAIGGVNQYNIQQLASCKPRLYGIQHAIWSSNRPLSALEELITCASANS